MPIAWNLAPLTAASKPSSDIVAVVLVAFDARGVDADNGGTHAAIYDLVGDVVFEDKYNNGEAVEPSQVCGYPIRGGTPLLQEMRRLSKLMRSVSLILQQAGVIPHRPPTAKTTVSWLFPSSPVDERMHEMNHLVDSLDSSALSFQVDYSSLGDLPSDNCLYSMFNLQHQPDDYLDGISDETITTGIRELAHRVRLQHGPRRRIDGSIPAHVQEASRQLVRAVWRAHERRSRLLAKQADQPEMTSSEQQDATCATSQSGGCAGAGAPEE